MAWDVNSFPQPSCPLEGQLSWVPVQAGFWFPVGGSLRLGWCARARGPAAVPSELISPLGFHLQGQAAFTLPLPGEVVLTLGS